MHEELQFVFGYNFGEFRRAQGLFARELAEAIGYGEKYIGAIERGDRNLTFQTAAHLSRLVGADPFDLLVRPPGWAQLRAAADAVDPGRRSNRTPKRPRPPTPTDD